LCDSEVVISDHVGEVVLILTSILFALASIDILAYWWPSLRACPD
jgi:hypothetical protein